MPTELGRNIDKVLRDIELEEEKADTTVDILDPEIEEQIREIYNKLQPTLTDIAWWGTICSKPDVLEEVISFYSMLQDIRYPSFIRWDGEKCVWNEYQYSLQQLQNLASFTERWKGMTEGEKAPILERAAMPYDVVLKGIHTLSYTIESLNDIATGKILSGVPYQSYIDQSNLRKSVDYWTSDRGEDLTRELEAAANGPYQYKGWLERYSTNPKPKAVVQKSERKESDVNLADEEEYNEIENSHEHGRSHTLYRIW